MQPHDTDSELSGWFSDVNASGKILQYLASDEAGLNKQAASILDLGTGNGELLFLLREEGDFEGQMLGVDYSEQSVQLCRKLAEGKGLGEDVEFKQWDIMSTESLDVRQGYDVVLDKGTFDAISLSEDVDEQGRRICEGYRERVQRLMKDGGLLLVTSCNWTEGELKRWFIRDELETVGRIEYPVFQFGGHTGQSVCSVCFRRRRKVE